VKESVLVLVLERASIERNVRLDWVEVRSSEREQGWSVQRVQWSEERGLDERDHGCWR
jgi:hypothetical protein